MPAPSTLTDEHGLLLSSTLRAYSPRIRDNIGKGNKFVALLDSKGLWKKQDGGERVSVPLMYELNTTADIYSGYGQLDTTPQDGHTTAFFEWSQMSVSISISRKEERQNSGRSKILSMLEAKIKQAENSLKELLNSCIVGGRITASADLGQYFARRGSLDSGAVGPLPIPALVDASPTRSVSIGNINGNTYSWWRNFATDSAASSFAGLKLEMNTMYNNCSRGSGGPPDLILSDQTGWETYWASLANLERYIVNDKKTLDVLGGSDALKFRNAMIIWDEITPDPKTNAEVVDAIGTHTLSAMYFLNTDFIEFYSDANTDFITTPFVRPENQDARVAQILWMGALGISNRRKHGVLMGIAKNITS
jgi:hypothetical protein